MKKRLMTILMIASALMMAGCGRKVAEEMVPSELATYLYKYTPDDGIDQTQDLQIDAVVGKEEKNEDGTISVPVDATITDLSKYTGKFNVVYEKTDDENDSDGWKIKTVEYIDRNAWVITPIQEMDPDVCKRAIVKRGAMMINGTRIDLRNDNVTDVALMDTVVSEDKQTVSANASFSIVDKIVTYNVQAECEFTHTINGYMLTQANVTDFGVVLNDDYVFTVSDSELINLLKGSALMVGETSVDLANVTAIKDRHDVFDPATLTMRIVADEMISNKFFDASVKVYYIYKLDEKQEYWSLDRYLADSFKVDKFKDMRAKYIGFIGNASVNADMVDFKEDGTFTAALLYSDDTEMEMQGRVDPQSLAVSMSETNGSLKLTGSFNADMGVFAGSYGSNKKWYFMEKEQYDKYIADKAEGKKTLDTEPDNHRDESEVLDESEIKEQRTVEEESETSKQSSSQRTSTIELERTSGRPSVEVVEGRDSNNEIIDADTVSYSPDDYGSVQYR